MSFRPLDLTEFNFLITTYSFYLLDPSRTIFEAEFQKGPLSITFISGKGEIDIDFWVSLEFTEYHAIFRPYISRDFPLSHLALRRNPGAFDMKPDPHCRHYLQLFLSSMVTPSIMQSCLFP